MKNFSLLYYSVIIAIFSCCSLSHSQSSATYDITFNSTWNAVDHTEIPANAHWSNLVGATHKNENAFLQFLQPASTGIRDVAELGSNHALMNEVQNSTHTKAWLNTAFNSYSAISSATLTAIEFTEEYHLLTLVSMIAPSPDWFIAVNSLDLRNDSNTGWKQSFTVAVFVYDAGTDSGSSYNAANMETSPPIGVFKINSAPFNGHQVGELVVTFKSSSLDTSEFKTTNTLKLFPNPSKGTVSITGIAIDLKSIEIFNILGSKVKTIAVSATTNRLDLDLADLKKGIYLVKLTDKNGNSKTQKLVLQ